MSADSATAPVVTQNAQRERVAGFLRQYGIVVVCVVVFLLLGVLQDSFMTSDNLRNIAYQNAPIAIIAVGTTIAIIAGGFDLSLGAVYALSGIVAAWIAVNVDPTVGLIVGVLVGLGVGLVNGALVTGLGLNSFLATLATALIIRALAVVISGGFLIDAATPSFQQLGLSDVLGLKIPTLIFIVVSIVLGLVLARSTFGRYVYAVGGNAEASRLSGVSATKVRLVAFAISGLGAGLAGVIGASRIGQGQTDVGGGYELTAIAAVVIGGSSITGGSGAIWRTVCGIALLSMITNAFNLFGYDPVYGDIATGAVILIAVLVNTLDRRS
jgi:ribose transport system permease protein